LHYFGKDSLTKVKQERLSRVLRIAAQEAAAVQCVGMHSPIRISDIYQPTRLVLGDQPTDFMGLLEARQDAIIFGRPGQGKTTLTHWAFTTLSDRAQKSYKPILFILRKPDAVEDLGMFVELVSSGKDGQSDGRDRLVLLVDGYDEVSSKERKAVSQYLSEFTSLGVGNFYLTCRDYYDVFDLKAPNYQIKGFDEADAINYIKSFCAVYGRVQVVPEDLLRELKDHGLSSFISHPLLIALVCILKTSSMPILPKNTTGLLERVLMHLTFRWDEAKGVSRESTVDLDGEERVRCMERIAYRMELPRVTQGEAENFVREHLNLIQRHVDTRKLLEETARFYGLLVPTPDGQWEFVHPTIQDYLAARFWVRGGEFSARKVVVWNLRAAYAACLSTNATESLESALRKSEDIFAISECLYNNAAFEPGRVSAAFVAHFEKFPDIFTVEKKGHSLVANTHQDVFHLASDDLLTALVLVGLPRRSPAHDLVASYALSELRWVFR